LLAGLFGCRACAAVATFASVVTEEEMHSAFVVLVGIALTLVPLGSDAGSRAERVSVTARFKRRDED
jgi:hypothetical protein